MIIETKNLLGQDGAKMSIDSGFSSANTSSDQESRSCQFCIGLRDVASLTKGQQRDGIDIRNLLQVHMGFDKKTPFAEASKIYLEQHYPEAGETHYSLPSGYLLKKDDFEGLLWHAREQLDKPDGEDVELPRDHAAFAEVFIRAKDFCCSYPSLLVTDYKFCETFNRQRAFHRALSNIPAKERRKIEEEIPVLEGSHDIFLSYPCGKRVYNIFFQIMKIPSGSKQKTVQKSMRKAIEKGEEDKAVFTTVCGPFLDPAAIVVAFPAFPSMERERLREFLQCDSCSGKTLTRDDLIIPDDFRAFLQRNNVVGLPEECSECPSAYSKAIDEQMEKTLCLLTPEQKRLVDADEKSSWLLIISGGSGTGKTLVVKERAKQLAQRDQNVEVLVVNLAGGQLTKDFRLDLQDEKNIKVLDGRKDEIPEDREGIFNFLWGQEGKHVLLDEVPLTLGISDHMDERSLSEHWAEISGLKGRVRSLTIAFRPNDATYTRDIDLQGVVIVTDDQVLGYHENDVIAILDFPNCKWRNYSRLISSCHDNVIIVMENEHLQTGKYSQLKISMPESIRKRILTDWRMDSEELLGSLREKIEMAWGRDEKEFTLLDEDVFPRRSDFIQFKTKWHPFQEDGLHLRIARNTSKFIALFGPPSSGKSAVLLESIHDLAHQARRDNHRILLLHMGSALCWQISLYHLQAVADVVDVVKAAPMSPRDVIGNARVDELMWKCPTATIHIHVDDYPILTKNTDEEIKLWTEVLSNLKKGDRKLTLTIAFQSHSSVDRDISLDELGSFFEKQTVKVFTLKTRSHCTSHKLLSHISRNETRNPLQLEARCLPTASRSGAWIEGLKPKYLKCSYKCTGYHLQYACNGQENYIGEIREETLFKLNNIGKFLGGARAGCSNCEDFSDLGRLQSYERRGNLDIRNYLKVYNEAGKEQPLKDAELEYILQHYPEANTKAYSIPEGYILSRKDFKDLKKEALKGKEDVGMPLEKLSIAMVFHKVKDAFKDLPSLTVADYAFTDTLLKEVLSNLKKGDRKLTLTIAFQSHSSVDRDISLDELGSFFEKQTVKVFTLKTRSHCTSDKLLSHISRNETRNPLQLEARCLPTASRSGAWIEGLKPKYLKCSYKCTGYHLQYACNGQENYIGEICEETLFKLNNIGKFLGGARAGCSNCEDFSDLGRLQSYERRGNLDIRNYLKVYNEAGKEQPLKDAELEYVLQHYPEANTKAYSLPEGYILSRKDFKDLKKEALKGKEDVGMPLEKLSIAMVFHKVKDAFKDLPSLTVADYAFTDTLLKDLGRLQSYERRGNLDIRNYLKVYNEAGKEQPLKDAELEYILQHYPEANTKAYSIPEGYILSRKDFKDLKKEALKGKEDVGMPLEKLSIAMVFHKVKDAFKDLPSLTVADYAFTDTLLKGINQQQKNKFIKMFGVNSEDLESGVHDVFGIAISGQEILGLFFQVKATTSKANIR
ncbi:unnamed protein product, partial [Darwinula stevensoni]